MSERLLPPPYTKRPLDHSSGRFFYYLTSSPHLAEAPLLGIPI
jgi:hypothetical protein